MKKIVAIFIMVLITTSTISVIGEITETPEVEIDFDIGQTINNGNLERYNQAVVNECEICGEENARYPVMTHMPPESERPMHRMISDPKPSISPDDLPSQFSWKDYGGDWTSPVKDQAYPVYCGSCYIFGCWGAFEAAINIASGYPNTDIDLSEQYGLSCINGGCYGCSGGWGSTMIENIVSTEPGQYGNGINGVPLESCMPYTATDTIPCDDKCADWDYHTDPLSSDNILWQIADWGWTSSFNEKDPNDWATIKSWLIEKGPLAVSMAWDNGIQNFVDTHHSPNDVYEYDSSDSTNHIILLCGWVDDSSIMNGGYWILKNSHGTVQGYGGFCNIAYGCNQLATSECSWIIAEEWPEEESGPGPINVDMAVFSDFDYKTEDGSKYPHPGEVIDFTDLSKGDVTLCEWDFNGDGIIDSYKSNPTWTYYNEGEFTVKLTVYSQWGLNSNRTKLIGIKENWPPVSVLPSEYVDNKLAYSFDGRYSYDQDDGDITSYLWDFDDGTSSDEIYLTHEFLEPNKIYYVTLTVTDDKGASDTATCEVKIDQTVPPETIARIAYIDSNEPEWFKTTARYILDATDWTSVINTFYRIDQGEWQKYINKKEISISNEGVHNLEFYSIDYYGNVEDVKSKIVKVDKTIPTLNAEVTGGEEVNGWYMNPVTVKLSGYDEPSGLDEILYQLDYGEWETYTSTIAIGQGFHVLRAIAVDVAGNTDGLKDPLLIKVDTNPPETSCSFEGEGTQNRFYKGIKIQLSAVDFGSGVESTYYKLDNYDAGFQIYSQPLILDNIGEYTISYYSVDNVGREEEIKSASFTVTNINFDMKITKPSNALYLFGIKFITLAKPFVIGSLNVEVSIESFTSTEPDVAYVEFYVDDVSIIKVTESPYVWDIDKILIGNHEIKAIAYTSEGFTYSDSLVGTFLVFR